MHDAAWRFIGEWKVGGRINVLDLGGLNINGSARAAFPRASYTALDLVDGPGVDIVADASTWMPDKAYDVVVCAEVFEHTHVWPSICHTALKALRPGGRFIVTCAGPVRAEHSAVDGGPLRDGEFYQNVKAPDLRDVLEGLGFVVIVCRERDDDTQAVASRP